MDIKQAYRMVPVHPQDRRLLGMRWEGSMYVDKILPFGLRSAPLIFSAVADALQWILRQKGVSFVEHYLDDFITLGKPGTDECASNQELILETCRATGTPIEPGKTESSPPCSYLERADSGHEAFCACALEPITFPHLARRLPSQVNYV